jgi:DNA-binding LacI/PurR family transcriptional regulator
VRDLMAHITQTDIARKLNVTRITVSKALRDHSDISIEMKKKVHETAEELGYIPNLIAQNLISKRTFTLGVVVPDLENSFFAYATDSIIDAATNKNYIVFVTVSRENQKQEKTYSNKRRIPMECFYSKTKNTRINLLQIQVKRNIMESNLI